MGVNVIANSFHLFFVFELFFSNKYAFHVHVTVIVISLFITLLTWNLSCHFLV